MLAVNGDDPGTSVGGPPHHERSGHDERLLVGQGHDLAGLDRRPRAPEPRRPHDGRDDPVDGVIGHEFVKPLWPDRQAGASGQSAASDLCRSLGIGHDQPAGPQSAGLLEERPDARVGCQQKGRQPTVRGLDHVDRALANAAGRTEHRHTHAISLALDRARSSETVRGVAVGWRHDGQSGRKNGAP